MKHLYRNIILGLIAFAFILPEASDARNSKPRWGDGAEERRSDYIYMEAQRQLALENIDAYYELLKRAYELNDKDLQIGHDLGLYTVLLAQGDEQLTRRGLEMIQAYFNAHPEDYYASTLYGSLVDRLGMTDRTLNIWEKLHDIFPEKTDVSMRLADAYLARTADTLSQAKARDLLKQIEIVEGPSLAITARNVMSYMAQRDTTAAIDDITRLVGEMPRSADARVYAGDVFMSLDDKTKALEYYNEACEADPSSGLAFYKRAVFYKETGDSTAYDREVFRALELPDLDLDTKLEIFTGYVKDLYTDSIQQPRINELFGKLIDMYPHESSIHDLYSSYFVAVKDYSSAAEQQEYVLDTDLSNVDRWRGLISLQYTAREYDKAFNTSVKAIESFPDEHLFKLLAGEAASVLEDFDNALKYLDMCIEADTLEVERRSQAMTARGDVVYKMGDVKGAIEMYEKALKVNPANAMAMNNCAYFMACEGIDIERAAELSRKSLNIDPDNESSLDTYAWIMFKMGDYKEAKTFIDKAFELTEEPTAELLQHRGDIYFMCGDPEQAVEFWEQAATLDPDDQLLQKKISHRTYFFK